MYLKFGSEEDWRYKKAMQYLAIFDGAYPLYIFLADTKKLKAAPPQKRVDVNDVLIKQLRILLGDANVVLVE